MKKILSFLLILLMPLIVNAAAVSDVDYVIEDVYINADVDILGSVHVTEGIVVKGSLNGFERVINFRNPKLKSYEPGNIDFSNSSIYNARNISLSKVSAFKIEKDKIGFNMFTPFLEKFSENNNAIKGDTGVYTKVVQEDGLKIRVYNPNSSGYMVYYFDYYLDQAVVLHNDVAELYWQFIPLDFDYIKKAYIQVVLPGDSSDEVLRVWAHGPLTGNVSMIKSDINDGLYRGLYAEVDDVAGTGVDVRLTFDKRLMSAAETILDKSEMDALDKIIEVETGRAEDANKKRALARTIMYILYTFSGLYLLGLVILWIYMYRKYDKEYNVNFQAKYYREFTGDYGVEVIDYLMNKNVSTDAFSASIMNLIYKKNIEVIDNPNDKKNPTLKLLTEENATKNEKIILELLFKVISSSEEVTIKDIKSFSSKYSTANKFMTKYINWVQEVKTAGEKEEFYEDHTNKKLLSVLYLLLGGLIVFLMDKFGINQPLLYASIIISSIAFLIYVCCFKKYSKKGREHYLKWKAFKNFLNDFGSFKEKELPEVKLWEKYLVYATVFGIAKNVQKTMQVKLTEFGYENDPYFNSGWFYRDYYFGNVINDSIKQTYTKSVSTINAATAGSSSSSGGGFGGGFSSGGGFGGGGGSGHGF